MACAHGEDKTRHVEIWPASQGLSYLNAYFLGRNKDEIRCCVSA